MIKIAAACDNGMIAEHFGHCENFVIFNTENDLISKSEIVVSPGHKPGFLPNFLNDMGVRVIIAGGIGSGAIDIFNEKGIKVIAGAGGDPIAAVMSYLRGTLISSASVCHEHQHSDSCTK